MRKFSKTATEILLSRYALPGETSVEQMFKRVCITVGSDEQHTERLMHYINKKWFMFASPIISDAGSKRGVGISCNLNYVEDSLDGLTKHFAENMVLSSNGAGVSSYFGDVRSTNTPTSRGSKTSGAINFMKIYGTQFEACQQGTRRGAYATYMPISHPEIMEFLALRKQTTSGEYSKSINTGVTIPDAFMNAVRDNSTWDLTDPHTKEITNTLPARTIWHYLLEMRAETGYPYIVNIDTVNRAKYPTSPDILQSNLCVAPETLILTDEGNKIISTVVGQTVNIWNGEQYSETVVRKTGDNRPLLLVTLSDGSELQCTPEHNFLVKNSYWRESVLTPTKDLIVGDKLEKTVTPLLTFTTTLPDAYTQGFFTGDGCTYKGVNHIDIYSPKVCVIPFLKTTKVYRYSQKQNSQRVFVSNDYIKFYVPDECTLNSRLEWFAGLLDADGCVLTNHKTQSIQLSSVNKLFIMQVRYLLKSLGVDCKVTLARRTGKYYLPDGKRGSELYNCQAVYRLLIGQTGVNKLLQLGMTCHRLVFIDNKPNRESTRLVKVVSVEDLGRVDDTYCVTEPLRGRAVFNGILTGNCSEILLATGPDRTAVCCLSSVNLDKFDEWKYDQDFIGDIVEMLDNVLDNVLNNNDTRIIPEGDFWRSKNSIRKERAIGLGAMGFHTYLQRNSMPIESPAAIGINKRMFEFITRKAEERSLKLGTERGIPEEAITGHRNLYRIAIAPNATSSIILGDVSPGIEPYPSNLYVHKTLSGSETRVNPVLERLVKEKGLNKENVLSDLVKNNGSVQNLPYFTDWEKSVFKTAWEINQHTLTSLAADRQPFICQGQSLNLFFTSNATRKYVNDVHFKAWEKGVKTLYYYRSTSAKFTSSEKDCEACEG
jgi:ribonucleoside-diphosphate reductase alpha chain